LLTGSLQRLVPLVDGALGVSLWLDAATKGSTGYHRPSETILLVISSMGLDK